MYSRFISELPTRKRAAKETLVQLADDIRVWSYVVYAELDFRTKMIMMIQHFNTALNDSAAQYETTESTVFG